LSSTRPAVTKRRSFWTASTQTRRRPPSWQATPFGLSTRSTTAVRLIVTLFGSAAALDGGASNPATSRLRPAVSTASLILRINTPKSCTAQPPKPGTQRHHDRCPTQPRNPPAERLGWQARTRSIAPADWTTFWRVGYMGDRQRRRTAFRRCHGGRIQAAPSET
jgi:hypothetical protein